MSNLSVLIERGWTVGDLGGGLLFLIGVALSGYGGYLHFTIAGKVSAGQCDACAPWHPLFVIATIVIGVCLVILGGYVLFRR